MMSRMFAFSSLVFLLAACAPPYPKYNPGWGGGELDEEKAYQRQVGDRTFVVTYQGYHRVRGLKGAQEYVLYRAGELTKSYGKKSFEVLYRDDWEFLYRDFRRRPAYRLVGLPGAGLVIRILDKDPLTIPREADDHVYEVRKLLDDLATNNPGLAEYQGRPGNFEETELLSDDALTRWRSVFRHYQLPSQWFRSVLEVSDPESPRKIINTRTGEIGEVIKTPSGKIEVVLRSRSGMDNKWPSPFEFLLLCATIAEREGYKVFQLENWAVEEHQSKPVLFKTYGLVFGFSHEFKIKAQILFLHQKDPDRLGPVFEVDTIRLASIAQTSCDDHRPC
jgi:hypothetical protein